MKEKQVTMLKLWHAVKGLFIYRPILRGCLHGGKNALYLSVNVFSTKVSIRGTTLTSPPGDGTQPS